MSLAIIIFTFFFVVLAIARLDYALFFIIATLPSYLIRFSLYGLPLTILEVMIIITFTVWFIKVWLPNWRKRLKEREGRLRYPFSWEIILLVISSFVAAGVAHFDQGALGIWKAYFFEPILVFILVLNLAQEKKDWQKILGAFLISALSVSLIAIYQKITGQFIFNDFWAQEATRRVVSWFGYPNAIGLYLAPLIMIFTGWFFSWPHQTNLSRSIKKILIIITIASAISAIYFAKSEGALIGLTAGFFVFGLLAGKKQRAVTLIISLGLVGLIVFSPTLKNIVINKITLQDLSGQIRERQWKETLLLLQGSKFITGAGLNNYQTAVAPYHQEGIFFNRDNLTNFDEQLRASSTLRAKYWQPVEIYLYPHNIFLNFWSEIGLIGALIFIWLIFKALYLSLKLTVTYQRDGKREKYLALGLMTALITILVHGLVDVPYFKNDLAVIFWIILAFIGLLLFNERFSSKNIRS